MGDVSAVFQLLAGLFQLVGDLADGGAEGFVGGGVFGAADAAEEIAVLGPPGFQDADALLYAGFVGRQVLRCFDLVCQQQLCFRNVAIQLDQVLPQLPGDLLLPFRVLFDNSQLAAVFEIQRPETGELTCRFSGRFCPIKSLLRGLEG